MVAETRDYSELMLASSPDLNQGPSDLQSDALPTELSRQLRALKLQGPAGLWPGMNRSSKALQVFILSMAIFIWMNI